MTTASVKARSLTAHSPTVPAMTIAVRLTTARWMTVTRLNLRFWSARRAVLSCFAFVGAFATRPYYRTTMERTEGEGGSRRRAPVVTVVRATCLAAAAVLLLTHCGPGSVRDDSAEAGFARDMATHHAQAAEMALIVRDVGADERLRALALDIMLTQATQRGVFMGWLQQWNLPQASSRPRMVWMSGHDHAASESERLMGMATADELARLRGTRGADAEVLFLQLMIRHHEGGVRMARAVLAESTREEVVAMARSIDESQTGEIALMIQMLAERGAKPLT